MKDFAAFRANSRSPTSTLLRLQIRQSPIDSHETWKLYLTSNPEVKIVLDPARIKELKAGSTLASVVLTSIYVLQSISEALAVEGLASRLAREQLEVLNTIYYILSVRPVVLYK